MPLLPSHMKHKTCMDYALACQNIKFDCGLIWPTDGDRFHFNFGVAMTVLTRIKVRIEKIFGPWSGLSDADLREDSDGEAHHVGG